MNVSPPPPSFMRPRRPEAPSEPFHTCASLGFAVAAAMLAEAPTRGGKQERLMMRNSTPQRLEMRLIQEHFRRHQNSRNSKCVNLHLRPPSPDHRVGSMIGPGIPAREEHGPPERLASPPPTVTFTLSFFPCSFLPHDSSSPFPVHFVASRLS